MKRPAALLNQTIRAKLGNAYKLTNMLSHLPLPHLDAQPTLFLCVTNATHVHDYRHKCCGVFKNINIYKFYKVSVLYYYRLNLLSSDPVRFKQLRTSM